MSDVVSTLTLRDRIRRDTGFENDSFALDAGLTDDILRSARWLADELISIGQEYARANTTINTVNGTAVYNLPADFYHLLAVHATTSGGKFARAEPFEMGDLEDLLNETTGSRTEFGRYRLGGAYAATPTETIEWSPTPSFARAFRLDYVPTPVFTIASGEYNVRCYGPGWEEFIVADVCARLLEREESDPSAFYARREQVLARIKRRAPTRDRGPVRPTRTRDPYSINRPRRPWPTERWLHDTVVGGPSAESDGCRWSSCRRWRRRSRCRWCSGGRCRWHGWPLVDERDYGPNGRCQRRWWWRPRRHRASEHGFDVWRSCRYGSAATTARAGANSAVGASIPAAGSGCSRSASTRRVGQTIRLCVARVVLGGWPTRSHDCRCRKAGKRLSAFASQARDAERLDAVRAGHGADPCGPPAWSAAGGVPGGPHRPERDNYSRRRLGLCAAC